MKKTTIRDIEIIYDDSHSSQMDYIKKVISNNYGWFLGLLGTSRIISLVPMENDDVIYLSDFDEFFYDAVRISFNNERIKQQCGDVNPIIFLYFMYLAKEIGNDENLLFKLNSMCDDDLLYSIIAYKYFLENGNFDDFVNYLKDRKDNDKIIGWLQEKARFDTYNFLLERLVKFLEENGFDFLEDICVLSDDMLSKLIVSVNSGLIEDLTGNKIKLPVISMDEFENLFYEFLRSINAPDEWFRLYDELKDNGYIIYGAMSGGNEESKCYVDDDGICKIFVSTDGTIRFFVTFVHEFIHYVSAYKTKFLNSTFSVLEFPSIFFEKMSAIFLENKGYSEDIVNRIIFDRTRNNIAIYHSLLPLFNDIRRYISMGLVSREDKIKICEDKIKKSQKFRDEFEKFCIETGKPLFNFDFLEKDKDVFKSVDDECDEYIKNYVKNGFLVINGFQYVLDTFLADNVLEKSFTDSTIVDKMIDVTNKLGNMNLSDILETFDMQDIFCQSEKSVKTKIKRP